MKKRILSLVLATLLIAAMAIPASAAQYTYGGSYESSTYEVVDRRTMDSYYSSTRCDSTQYLLYSVVELRTDTEGYLTYTSRQATTISEISGGTLGLIIQMNCQHFVDGYMVHYSSVP